MGAKRKKGRAALSNPQAEIKGRVLENVRLVNQILDHQPVDTAALRKFAAVRGLVNSKIRARAWPLLLGVEAPFDWKEYSALKEGKHRDKSVVTCDVERSLWFYTEGWTQEEREQKRETLRAVLTAVVCKFPDDVHYYQGLHDIASVLIFTAGEKQAFRMLSCMAVCHLRDCTRPTLDAVLELLQLLMPLLKQADIELYNHVEASGVPPFFSLSWFITWFAHNIPSFAQITRMFDLLLSSHPLMPLYVSVVAMRAARESILNCEADPSEMHRTLTNLPILGSTPADEIAQQAVFLFKKCPPAELLRISGLTMTSATAAEAKLEDGRWIVPQKRVIKRGIVSRVGMEQLTNFTLPERNRFRQATTVASVASFVLLSYAAIYMSQVWQSTSL